MKIIQYLPLAIGTALGCASPKHEAQKPQLPQKSELTQMLLAHGNKRTEQDQNLAFHSEGNRYLILPWHDSKEWKVNGKNIVATHCILAESSEFSARPVTVITVGDTTFVDEYADGPIEYMICKNEIFKGYEAKEQGKKLSDFVLADMKAQIKAQEQAREQRRKEALNRVKDNMRSTYQKTMPRTGKR